MNLEKEKKLYLQKKVILQTKEINLQKKIVISAL